MGEVVGQQASPAISVRLPYRPDRLGWITLARGLQRHADFCRVVSIIAQDRNAACCAHQLEAPGCAPECCKRSDSSIKGYTIGVHGGQRSQSIQDVVFTGQHQSRNLVYVEFRSVDAEDRFLYGCRLDM